MNFSSFSNIEVRVRNWLARRLRGRFSLLYSTVDTPDVVVPIQVAAYQLAGEKYIHSGDRILDVGFGLGYGLLIMADTAGELTGIDIDKKAVRHGDTLIKEEPKIKELQWYDGNTIPYGAGSFDVVTCIDVLEHVADYSGLIQEMLRVSNRIVLISTPNRRPENTMLDGRPKNYWHLREWSYEELSPILLEAHDIRVEWNFLNGPWDGPFKCESGFSLDTYALTPALTKKDQG